MNQEIINQDKSWAYADVLINLGQANAKYGQDVMGCVEHKFDGSRIQRIAIVNIREEKIDGYTQTVGDIVGEKYYRTGSDLAFLIAEAFEFTPNPNYNGPTPDGMQVAQYQERYWATTN